ncbi:MULTISPECIES: PIN domain-containing protein [unclassified Pseudomonas]|uniref:PIN domain-containing protein n=1 Tax=unclassified Pseudomonas TaxID=196821 RepID=UPI001B330F5C|nr:MULTISPECIES: PIN domain-containing protein [unclassified Pseudomonas]
MKFHSVVIDTNFLMRDYPLRGNALQKIIKTKSFYALEICIPEVVRDECIGNYAEDMEAASKELIGLSDKFDRLGLQGVLSKNTAIKKIDSSRQKYARRLDDFIAVNGVKLLPYPAVRHKDVVERMYQQKKPFTDGGVREKGYKDFLIIASIEDYLKQGVQDNVLLLTENVADFACAKALSKKENPLLPLDDQYGLSNVYVARSATVLFSALSSNIGQSCSSEVINTFNEKLVRAVSKRLSDLDAELLLDLFGAFLDVSIEQDTISCEVIESQIQVDDEAEIMEAKGIIKISFRCKFSVDNFDVQVKIVDDQFVFMKQVKDRVFQERLPWRGEWSENFSNVEFSKEFLFEYIDINYVESNEGVTDELDTLYLSVSRL